MLYLNGLLVFATFINLILNFAKRSSWSKPQSAPGLVFADCLELFHLWLQREYNQSDFGIDHLVMSMCRAISYVAGRGCLLWSMYSLDKALLAFALTSFCTSRPNLLINSRDFLTSYFYISVPMMKRTFYFGVSSRRSCRSW